MNPKGFNLKILILFKKDNPNFVLREIISPIF